MDITSSARLPQTLKHTDCHSYKQVLMLHARNRQANGYPPEGAGEGGDEAEEAVEAGSSHWDLLRSQQEKFNKSHASIEKYVQRRKKKDKVCPRPSLLALP